MKLFIEVELGPDEVPLATELFRTLRLLTDHVKTRDLKKLFSSLIMRLNNGELEEVASEITTILTELESSEMVLDDFISAFEDVVFSRDTVVRHNTILPYMKILPRLPNQLIAKMKETFLPKVLKHLTLKRPIDASRLEFFLFAEAFAALVSLEFVPISGAVRSIISLLRKNDARCAAVTMLGKTVELCSKQLSEKCEASIIADLRAAVESVTEQNFRYDISYIEETMGWSRSSLLPRPY